MTQYDEYTPEQLEAMQEPFKKKEHTFVNELFNQTSSFYPQDLHKGIAYLGFMQSLDLRYIEKLISYYDQVILIFKNIEDMSEFMNNELSVYQSVAIYFDNGSFDQMFRFVIKQIKYTHCVIKLYIDQEQTVLDLDKRYLKSSIVYHYNALTIYPSYIIQTMNLNYTINQFIRVYINEMCNHSVGLSHASIGMKSNDQNFAIDSFNDIIDAVETINAVYTETLTVNPIIETKVEVNSLIYGIKSYINKVNKKEKQKVKSYIMKQCHYFNYSLLNKDDAETLVIAYCFPPFIDTSGNVMAKRIRDRNEVVDIISNNMSKIRKTDLKLNSLSEHLVDKHYLLDAKQAFSSWESISGFTEKGLEVLKIQNKNYENLYSRAMFPQSHFLAFEIKILNPNMYWRAEFSDPLHSTVTSDIRYAPITDEQYIQKIKHQLKPDLSHLVDDNVFNVCELLALSHADELIFTNENQLEYMIERFDDQLKQSIRNRAIISRHPIPHKADYNKVISNYHVSPDYINLGYFGNFYATRGFNEIELVCKYLEAAGEKDFRIHCFTNINGNVKRMYQASDFQEYIVLHPLVGYFEFLNITTMLDALLLFDAHTIDIKPINPYIPSKLSDYKGSGKLVWAFTEENSVMDRESDILHTHMTDYEDYKVNFEKIKKSVSRFSH